MKDQSDTPLRYVILHHTGIAEPHYDLMFERRPGGTLITFRSPAWPIDARTIGRILDAHRREYLEYEGPVSGDRGHVRRVQEGTFELHPVRRAPPCIDLILLTPTRQVLRVLMAPNSDVCSFERVE